MTSQYPEPKTETEGSSMQTAVAVGAGAVVGSLVIAAAAPVVLPLVGLGVVAGLFGVPIIGGTIGAIAGWKMFGKK